jgi:hypothetical protein
VQNGAHGSVRQGATAADATVRSLVTRIADALTHPSSRPAACGNRHTPPAPGVAAPDQL